MTPLLAAVLLLQSSGDTRVRTQLPNGCRVFAEQRDGGDSYTLVLAASAAGVVDTADTHGFRHMVEHLCVKGHDQLLDRRLESRGAVLEAETTRDMTVVTITGPSDTFPIAVEALAEVLAPLKVTPEAVVKEAKIIAEEDALRPAWTRFSAAAWSAGTEGGSRDPFGSADALAKATPESLAQVHDAIFEPSGISVAVVGRVNPAVAASRLTTLLGPLVPRNRPAMERKMLDTPDKAHADAPGEARAALVGGLGEPNTIHVMAAAMALRSIVPTLRIGYTPSPYPGYLVVFTPEAGSLAGIDTMADSDKLALFVSGRAMVRAWVAAQMDTSAHEARLRAIMMVRFPGFDPQSLSQAAETITPAQFRGGINLLSKDFALQVGGN